MIDPLSQKRNRALERGEVRFDLCNHLIGDLPARQRLDLRQAHGFDLSVEGVLVDRAYVFDNHSLRRRIGHKRLNRAIDGELGGRMVIGKSWRGRECNKRGNSQSSGVKHFHQLGLLKGALGSAMAQSLAICTWPHDEAVRFAR